LKLREYLASGIPVVTTEFNAMREYQDLVEVVNSTQHIADAIVRAAKRGNDLNAKAKRIDRVSSASWQERAKLVDSYLMSC
jgi:glycosyltransferase involved in cell wall biosynthesis